jgi:predicted 2-oxoglutarate/Fe(II)-dependent dioxygenase YbiX
LIFPADARTRVAGVRQGRRLLMTSRIQSFVRSAARRRVLFDFARALQTIEPDARLAEQAARLRRTRDELLRHWAEGP